MFVLQRTKQMNFRRTVVALALAAVCAMGAAVADETIIDGGSNRMGSRSEPTAAEQSARVSSQRRLMEEYGKLPLSFEPNQGQADRRVKFLSRGPGYTLFLTQNEAVLALRKLSQDSKAAGRLGETSKMGGQAHSITYSQSKAAAGPVLAMRFAGANPRSIATGVDRLPGKSNYFIGNDPTKWRTGVPNYARVKYENAYPGVDLVYYGNQGQLEYDFVIAPGIDPAVIQLHVGTGAVSARERAQGARLRIDRDGDLIVKVENGELRLQKPQVYQPSRALSRVALERSRGESRIPIEARYKLSGHNQVSFELGPFDSAKPLVIDPALIYSTYLGGSKADAAYSIAVDNAGEAYVSGDTEFSTDFPVTTGAFQTVCPADCNATHAFVTKLDASGSALVYSTYLGGSNAEYEYLNGIAVDSSGNAYVTGTTYSSDFPTTSGAFQTALGGNGSVSNAFVTKVNATGSALVYSTYLGGSGGDQGLGMALDAADNAYVTGSTSSIDFPITPGALQTACGGGCVGGGDAFVAKLNTSGSALVYSTYLGGSASEQAPGVSVDPSGNAYVTGGTYSTDFPTTAGAFQTVCGGDCTPPDAFVTKLNSTGSALLYSTYLGGSGNDWAYAMAVDMSGNAYVTGHTSSIDFPITAGAFQTACGGGCVNWDAFITKLNPAGAALVYSTYLGGSNYEEGDGIAIDELGSAYVVGNTSSSDFPVTSGAFQAVCNRGTNCGSYGDGFVTNLNTSGAVLLYSTYLGGSSSDGALGVAVGASGYVYIAGSTNSLDFPTTAGAFQPVCRGDCASGDAFITKFDFGVDLSSTALAFGNQTLGITSPPQSVSITNNTVVALNTSSIGISGANAGDFAETNTCGASLPSGANCTITVTFTPSLVGNETATLTVAGNAPSGSQTVSLTGTGVQPVVALLPTSLTFPTQVVFTPSKIQTVTVRNAGTGTLTIASIAATGQFSQTNTCGTRVASGASCTISVTFRPKNKGPLNGAVTLTDNAPDSPQKVTLAGTGTYVQLTSTSLNFGNQPVGTKSLPKKITLSNKGSATVSISGITVTGANNHDFAQTNTCGSSVASGASCFITVTFTPSAKGKRTASVSVSDNGGGSPQTVGLAGTGT
jgi:hypothetical protein